MAQLLHLLLAVPAQPPDGVSISWEGLAAIGAIVLALAAIFGAVYAYGALANKLDTTAAAVEKNREEARTDQAALTTQVTGLVSAVGQLQGEIKRLGRKRGDSDD